MEARANNVTGEGLCISGLAGDARDAHSVNCNRIESLCDEPDRQDELEQSSRNEPDQSGATNRVDESQHVQHRRQQQRRVADETEQR